MGGYYNDFGEWIDTPGPPPTPPPPPPPHATPGQSSNLGIDLNTGQPVQAGTATTFTPGSDPIEWMRSQFPLLPPTTASLEKLFNTLKAAGVNVEWATHAGGARSDDKFLVNNF